MSKRSCSQCVYFGDCGETSKPCRYFTPEDELPTDEECRELVEAGRSEFFEAWAEYVAENGEVLFF